MSATTGFGEPPYHVAQRSRRDKLRFPAATDMMLTSYDDSPFATPPADAYVSRASAAELGYLHAVVAPPPPAATGEPWLAPQYDALSPWTAGARAKTEHEGAGPYRFASQAALSLTLSPAPQELPTAYGGSLQSVVGAVAAAGPLGPFTGYAAVLKGSRFLRPAQQLLDEICVAVAGVECTSGNVSAVGSYSGASPTSLSSSTDTCDRQHQRPEFREKKAKLLYMQEEVCKRYRHYHQQMQMVVSSFESVPGLSSATPYASSALKAIPKHFRRVRSIISSQVQYISRLLGEELLSLPSSSGGGKATPRLGLTEHSQPVWRPQRGLPERAVSVLRAWLFDHFLHPYPTDADKHMLATQTGLSRNQVSNWFINARVRLWKPMVEEIHMLETRGGSAAPNNTNASSSDSGSNCNRSNPAAVANASRAPLPPLPHPGEAHQMLEQCLEAPMGGRSVPPHCSGIQGGGQVMMSFGGAAPFAGGTDMAGFGAVSLTLGLRRDVSYQQQQQFGGQMLGDLVG